MPRAEAKYRITADDQTARGIRSAESRLRRMGRSLARIGTVVAGVLVAAFAALTAGLTKAQAKLDRLAKSAKELGTSAEDVRELSFAAEQLGVAPDKATKAVDRLNRAIGETLTNPVSEFADDFETLGVSAQQLASYDDATDKLVAVSAALEDLERRRGREIRESVEQSLVGKNLSKLLDSQGLLREISRANNELGLIGGTSEAAAAAERAGDAWNEAGKVWLKLIERAGLFDALASIANVITKAGAFINRVSRGGPAAAPQSPEQQGVFVLQRQTENLDRSTKAQTRASVSLDKSAATLERVINRYQ